MKSLCRLVLLALAVVTLAPVSPAQGQTIVAPGGTVTFSTADGGTVACRRLEAFICIPGVLNGSADPAGRFVSARSIVPITGVGIPNYATATVYNDFLIAGAAVDQVVNAQIDVAYDFFSSINVAALSKVEVDLSVSITDVTWGAPGIPVAAAVLVHQNRTSDQGVTDVAQGNESNNLAGANAHFQAQLRRGHTYRAQFTLETLGEVSLLGVARAVAQASWSRLAVTVDEDEVELLSTHDTDMKGLLASHDAEIKALLAAHDQDIKALLAEVIRLLNTPQGRRPLFPIN